MQEIYIKNGEVAAKLPKMGIWVGCSLGGCEIVNFINAQTVTVYEKSAYTPEGTTTWSSIVTKKANEPLVMFGPFGLVETAFSWLQSAQGKTAVANCAPFFSGKYTAQPVPVSTKTALQVKAELASDKKKLNEINAKFASTASNVKKGLVNMASSSKKSAWSKILDSYKLSNAALNLEYAALVTIVDAYVELAPNSPIKDALPNGKTIDKTMGDICEALADCQKYIEYLISLG